jgi:hypothetical protein
MINKKILIVNLHLNICNIFNVVLNIQYEKKTKSTKNIETFIYKVITNDVSDYINLLVRK